MRFIENDKACQITHNKDRADEANLMFDSLIKQLEIAKIESDIGNKNTTIFCLAIISSELDKFANDLDSKFEQKGLSFEQIKKNILNEDGLISEAASVIKKMLQTKHRYV